MGVIVSVAVKQVLTGVFEVVFTMDRVDEVVGGQDFVVVPGVPVRVTLEAQEVPDADNMEAVLERPPVHRCKVAGDVDDTSALHMVDSSGHGYVRSIDEDPEG